MIRNGRPKAATGQSMGALLHRRKANREINKLALSPPIEQEVAYNQFRQGVVVRVDDLASIPRTPGYAARSRNSMRAGI
jgi:hypothetical protein